jgi:hypothetical protein
MMMIMIMIVVIVIIIIIIITILTILYNTGENIEIYDMVTVIIKKHVFRLFAYHCPIKANLLPTSVVSDGDLH